MSEDSSNTDTTTSQARQPATMTTMISAPTVTISPSDSTRPTTTRQRSSSLLHKNVLSRMRALPFQYVFTFWHTNHSTQIPKCLSEYVPDVGAFYKIHNNFPFTSLPTKDSVHFFRTGVKPLWEDKENLNGGCWTIKVRKEDGRSLKVWEEICLLVLGGEVQSAVARERDHILGISYSPRLYVAHISIWTKQGDNTSSVNALQKTILSRLSAELRPTSEFDYYYKKHSEHDGWTQATKQVREARQLEQIQESDTSDAESKPPLSADSSQFST